MGDYLRNICFCQSVVVSVTSIDSSCFQPVVPPSRAPLQLPPVPPWLPLAPRLLPLKLLVCRELDVLDRMLMLLLPWAFVSVLAVTLLCYPLLLLFALVPFKLVALPSLALALLVMLVAVSLAPP